MILKLFLLSILSFARNRFFDLRLQQLPVVAAHPLQKMHFRAKGRHSHQG